MHPSPLSVPSGTYLVGYRLVCDVANSCMSLLIVAVGWRWFEVPGEGYSTWVVPGLWVFLLGFSVGVGFPSPLALPQDWGTRFVWILY